MEEEDVVMEGLMASQREIFSISGPIHLTSIDWSNSYHRTSVAACLVQGVYTLERDRQQNRVGPKSEASPWWEFFDFTLVKTLIDDTDHSIYGAVFKYKLFARHHHNYYDNALHRRLPPRYVIAFRGMIRMPHSLLHDLKLDLRCIFDKLHNSTRYLHAMQVVQTTVAKHGPTAAKHEPTAVWLAGHSLGAAMALLAGKTMTKKGFPVQAYLFNPPFPSIPIEKLKSEKLKNGIRFAGSLAKAGLAVAVKGRHQKAPEDDPFVKLASWIPSLYVNPSDPICSEYIGYFEHRKQMIKIGAGKIEQIATRNSVKSLLFGGSSDSSEPLHLLPTASLTINKNEPPDFKRAHEIHQWWDRGFNGQCVLHQFHDFAPTHAL